MLGLFLLSGVSLLSPRAFRGAALPLCTVILYTFGRLLLFWKPRLVSFGLFFLPHYPFS